MEILDFFLFWHGHCKLFRSVISFSVINYVVSMRCPRVSDDSSFFLRFAQKNELKPSTPSQALPDSCILASTHNEAKLSGAWTYIAQ